MDFHTQFDAFIRDCKQYQKEVDAKGLNFKEPYQSIYLHLNKVLKVHTDQKLDLEAMEAGEQSAPGFPTLTPARRAYYDLEAAVPSFLANGGTAYYYLQRYKISCVHLLKTFTYSSYKGDWEKMRHLGNWLAAIYDQQGQNSVKDSLASSFEEIENFGNFNTLTNENLQLLEEEVRNIQALLLENPDLQTEISADQADLLQEAAEYLKTKEKVLNGLPELDNDFKYDEPPVVEIVAARCNQLIMLLDKFHKDDVDDTLVTELTDFKQELRDSFDLHIGICADIYNSMIKAMGSFQSINIKQLCAMLHEGLNLFVDEGYLYERYGTTISVNHITVTKGMPDTIDLEMLLMIAVGDI